VIDARNMAVALGGDVIAGGQVLAPGPGHSARDRSLHVLISHEAPDGFVVRSYAGDDWRACRDHVRQRIGIERQPPTSRSTSRKNTAPPPVADDEARSLRAREIWHEAVDPRGTIVENYLAGRQLVLPECAAGYALRYHPGCPWEDSRAPAMVAAFRSIANDRAVIGIHRTALTPQGEKIGRKMLGPARDAAIMLDPDEAVSSGLVVCEGIESGLAGRQLGWRPVWALGSAGAIGRFPVLSGIECLTILAELDDTGANMRAVQDAGVRWTAAGREVLTVAPRHGGDANDALRAAHAAA
jgi:putative DNA primase/helicase